MKLDDLCVLALDNLRRTKLRTLLTMLGVIIGVGVLVSMISFGAGMQKNVVEEFKENDLFTTLQVLPGETDPEGGARDTDGDGSVPALDGAALEAVQALPGVEVAFPVVRFPIEVRLDGREAQTTLQAMPAAMGGHRPFRDLSFGCFFASDSDSSVVISARVLRDLGIELSDTAGDERTGRREDPNLETVSMPSDSILGRGLDLVVSSLDEAEIVRAFGQLRVPRSGIPVRRDTLSLTIVGIRTKLGAFEGRRFASGVIVPLGLADEIPRFDFSSVWDLLGGKQVSGAFGALHVRARTVTDVASVSRAVEEMGFEVLALADQLEEFKREFAILDTVLGSIGTIALIVASLGIVNTMVTSILERTREIGIMKAIGGSESDIKLIFFLEAGAIGALGGVFGLGLGWIVTRIANVVANHYLRTQGVGSVDLFHMPLWLVAGAVGFSIVVSLLAGVYPAVRAARIDPVVALRHD